MRRTITTPATCTRSQWTYYELWTGETMLFYPFCFQYCSLRHSFYIFFNSLNSILNGPLPGARETRKCFVTKSEISMDTWARGFVRMRCAHTERDRQEGIYTINKWMPWRRYGPIKSLVYKLLCFGCCAIFSAKHQRYWNLPRRRRRRRRRSDGILW